MHRNAIKSVTALFSALLLTAYALPGLAESGDASEFIRFEARADMDCSEKGGERVYVVNSHPGEIIDLQIDRYFYQVRQAGRSMFPIRPGASQAMGCNVVLGDEQRWELIDARFISEADALARYGLIP